jgi:transcription elongation GreA/GreB family factor
MSRAFVKEDAAGGEDPLPDRPVSTHPNYVTSGGLAQIDAELARLQAALVAAGDDRGARAVVERDLRYWRARRANAEVIPPPADGSVVRFGSTVTIERDDGREQVWRIVGEDEADPKAGTLSHVSPLARALIGKAVGDSARVAEGEAEIVQIA